MQIKNFFKTLPASGSAKDDQGFAMIEIVIATALISVLTLALVSVTQKSLELADRSLRQTQASFLLEEGVEAVKTIRDESWLSIEDLTVGTEYYLYYDTISDTWSLSETPNTIDDFTRKVFFSTAYRDGSDDLIVGSGTEDPSARLVNVFVEWASIGGDVSKELSFYLIDLFS